MQFSELLPKRRMVRHYAAEPVAREALERIVSTIRRAPSAGYSQGQRLLVVTGDEGRADLLRIANAGWAAADDRLEPWLETAQAHVFVCVREADYHERYLQEDKLVDDAEIEWPVPFWYVDAGAVLMLVLLAAIDEGLAAGVTGVPREVAAERGDAFGVPSDVTIVAHVTIGVPAPDPGWSAVTSRRTKPRRAESDSVHWERW
jgi:FMN reductase [NAD(P)H]